MFTKRWMTRENAFDESEVMKQFDFSYIMNLFMEERVEGNIKT